MKYSFQIIILLLAALAFAQDNLVPLQHFGGPGQWKSIADSRENSFPRYFICGAEMNNFKMTSPYNCSIKKDKRQPYLLFCSGGQTQWDRANGIKFKYCHYQNWQDQTTSLYFGSYEWQGLKMCPKDHYVSNVQTKTNDVEGLVGLMLLCKSKYTFPTVPAPASIPPANPLQITTRKSRPRWQPSQTINSTLKQIVQVVIKDGKGQWKNITNPNPDYFAAFYQVRIGPDLKNGQFLSGIGIHFRPFPHVTNMVIDYILPPPVDFQMQTVYSTFWQNKSPTQKMNITYQQTSRRFTKQFSYTLINTQSKFHNIKFYNFMKFDSSQQMIKLTLPTIFTKLDQQDLQVDKKLGFRLFDISLDDLQFNKNMFTKPYSFEPLKMSINPCTKLVTTQRYFYAELQAQYIMTVTFTSLSQTYTQTIRGIYKGTIISRPQVISYQQALKIQCQ